MVGPAVWVTVGAPMEGKSSEESMLGASCVHGAPDTTKPCSFFCGASAGTKVGCGAAAPAAAAAATEDDSSEVEAVRSEERR